jgi:hypothetical protein
VIAPLPGLLPSADAISFLTLQSRILAENSLWNELLVGHMDSVDAKNLPTELKVETIEPANDGIFPLTAIDARQRLVFEAIKAIWAQV